MESSFKSSELFMFPSSSEVYWVIVQGIVRTLKSSIDLEPWASKSGYRLEWIKLVAGSPNLMVLMESIWGTESFSGIMFNDVILCMSW